MNGCLAGWLAGWLTDCLFRPLVREFSRIQNVKLRQVYKEMWRMKRDEEKKQQNTFDLLDFVRSFNIQSDWERETERESHTFTESFHSTIQRLLFVFFFRIT